jgi:chorismate mutase
VTIDDYRKEINRLDSELLRIFNERAALALKIGEIKKEMNIPVYDPARDDESRRLERIRTKGL